MEEPGRRWIGAMVVALFLSHTGTFLQLAAQAWYGWELTGSYRYLGFLGLAQASPLLGLPLLGGQLADRFERRTLLLVTQIALFSVAAAAGILALMGHLTEVPLLLFAGATAALAAIDNPVRQVYLPGVVGREERTRIVGLNATAYNGAAVIGPALAGIVLATAGAGPAFLLNSATYLLLALVLIPGPRTRSTRPDGVRPAAVLDYLRSNRAVLWTLVMVGTVSLLGRSHPHILPALADDLWNTGPSGYGLLAGLPGVGAVLAAITIAWRGRGAQPTRRIVPAALLLGATLILLAFAPGPLTAAPVLVLIGLGATGTMILLNAGLQVETPDDVRGRVMSLYVWLAAGMPALGGFLVGGTMSFTTPALVLVGAGAILAIVALGIARRLGSSSF